MVAGSVTGSAATVAAGWSPSPLTGAVGCVGRLVSVAALGQRLAVGSQDHRHVPTLETGLRLDLHVVTDELQHVVEDLRSELRVGHLSSPELHRHLDLVPFVEELVDLAHLRVEVTTPDLRLELDLLDGDVHRLPAGFLGLLGFLVAELPVVHDPAHRRVGHRRDLDEVEIEFFGHAQSVGNRLDPELIAVRTDEADLTGADAVVDPVLCALWRGYGCSPLCNG